MRIKGSGWVLALVASLSLASWPAVAHEGPHATEQTLHDANRAFIDLMVPHHQSGIEMANEAIAKASHPELKAFAQRMKVKQSKDIEQMKSWRQAWFGSAVTPMPMPMAQMAKDKDFDRMWMTQLIDHHQNAIDISTLALGQGVRNEIKGMAQRQISDQSKEQAQMRSWLKTWYGK